MARDTKYADDMRPFDYAPEYQICHINLSPHGGRISVASAYAIGESLKLFHHEQARRRA